MEVIYYKILQDNKLWNFSTKPYSERQKKIREIQFDYGHKKFWV